MRRVMLALVVVALVGCGGSQNNRPKTEDQAIVFIDSPRRQAGIWIDGRYLAPVGSVSGGFVVAPGEHRLEVREDGYHTFYAEFSIKARERKRLTVELAEVLD